MTTITRNRLLVSSFSIKNEMERLLLLTIVFSTGLLVTRVIATGSFHFLSLEWNLFLAIIPYLFSRYLFAQQKKRRIVAAVISFLWLLFIPNSFYIITDLFHLGENGHAPLWYDLLLIFSFAWNGLILGILSVRQMEKQFHRRFPRMHEWIFLFPVMWLSALGVYIGRYLRYNSWDIITSPFRLFADIVNLLMHPLENKNAFAMVLCFSVFMTLIYLSIKKLSSKIR